MRVVVAQLNPVVGDLDGNGARLLAAAARAQAAGAELLVAPELALSGYPPLDLLDRPAFLEACAAALGGLAAQAPLPMLIGAPVPAHGPPAAPARPPAVANAAVLLAGGGIAACHRKNLLPAYDVFDEPRVFCPGEEPTWVEVGGVCVGLTVCEDVWNDATYWPQPRYARDPVAAAVAGGARLIINLSASPFRRGGFAARRAMLAATARRHRVAVLYVNQVGGNDSLVFDGRSLALGPGGEVTWQAPAFVEAEAAVELGADGVPRGPVAPSPDSGEPEVLAALCLGLGDYLRKCGQKQVVLGLSGGVDSAVVAALAARALGPEAVSGLTMPAPHSSPGSVTDARALAANLGIRCHHLPLAGALAAIDDSLRPGFAGRPHNVTEENLQARLRGLFIMAHANKFGAVALSTGNKSEVAVGYTTLYGDMCGGLAPVSDLYKTQIYALAHHINQVVSPAPIPQQTLTKPPSAELRPGQVDQDSLPPYPVLDDILARHLEGGAGLAALVAAGHAPQVAGEVLAMVARSEHKRRQMAPGLRVSARAFGEGWRLPVAARAPA